MPTLASIAQSRTPLTATFTNETNITNITNDTVILLPSLSKRSAKKGIIGVWVWMGICGLITIGLVWFFIRQFCKIVGPFYVLSDLRWRLYGRRKWEAEQEELNRQARKERLQVMRDFENYP